ncbi:MAG: sigma-70 family RNA polymerase sigma factor [Terrimonas sp.]|nr:sigma-70 family RNA polymerase sigma factor [Terrimonas sp.]
MLGVCMRYARSKEDAEEILHEGFLRVFKYIQQYKGTGSLEGWIRKIMVNCALLKYREKARLVPVIELNEFVPETGTDAGIQEKIDVKELLQLIQNLPAGYRVVFNLYVFEGYKHREIAELLGISEGTSKSNLFDARAILQKEIISKKKINYYR